MSQASRKNYFVKKNLQLRFIGNIFMMIFLLILVVSVNFYFFGYYYIEMIGSEKSGAIFALINDVYGVLQSKLVLLVLSNVLIIFFIGVFFSHQFAGPIYKLEQALIRMGSGDLAFRFGFRKSDGLDDLSDKMNIFLGGLRDTMGQARAISVELSAKTKEPEVKARLAEVIGLIDRYKIEEPACCKGCGQGQGQGQDQNPSGETDKEKDKQA